MNDLPNLSLFDLLNIQCLTAVAHPQQVWYTSSYKANTSAIKLKVCFFILCQKKKKERKKSPEIPKLPASSSLRQHTHCLNSTTSKGKEQQRKAVGVSSQQPCDKCNNFQLVFTALELWALWSEDAFAALKVRGYTSVQMSCFIAFRFPAWTGREVRSANIYRSDCCALRRKEKKIQTYFLGSLWRFFCVLDYFECCPDIRLIISHLLKVYRL